MSAPGLGGGTGSSGSPANTPSDGQKAALVGSNGTPGALNPYVTDSDPRNTDARTPTSHASSHVGGADAIAVAVANVSAGLLSGAWAALLSAATNAATVATLVLRDAAGRFKAANPDASDDVDTKDARDTAISAAIRDPLIASLSSPLAVLGSVSNQVAHTITVASTTKKTYLLVASGYFTNELGTNEGFCHEVLYSVYRSGGGTINVTAATVIVNREQYAGVNTRLVGGASLTVQVDTPTLTPTTWVKLDVREK